MNRIKIFTICISVLVVSVFTGCKSTRNFVSSSKKIELRGNPTTGYTWEYTVSNEGICDVIEDVLYLGPDGVTGAPSLFNYEIISRTPGNTHINFKYHRPWLKDSEIDERVYEVSVSKSGKIRLKRIKAGNN